jgi:hypothetical protein
MKGSVVRGEEVIFERVRVSLAEEPRQMIWGGFVYLPRAEMEKGEYELRLEDGRSGTIRVVSVKDGTLRRPTANSLFMPCRTACRWCLQGG